MGLTYKIKTVDNELSQGILFGPNISPTEIGPTSEIKHTHKRKGVKLYDLCVISLMLTSSLIGLKCSPKPIHWENFIFCGLDFTVVVLLVDWLGHRLSLLTVASHQRIQTWRY